MHGSFFYCFTYTTYNATLTFPTLHTLTLPTLHTLYTLVKILTLCYITVPNTTLERKGFTDFVLFKYYIFLFLKKNNKKQHVHGSTSSVI